MEVAGEKGGGARAGRLGEYVSDDRKLLGLQPEWTLFRDMWRDFIWGKRLTLAYRGRN